MRYLLRFAIFAVPAIISGSIANAQSKKTEDVLEFVRKAHQRLATPFEHAPVVSSLTD